MWPGELEPLGRPQVEDADGETEGSTDGQGKVGGTRGGTLPEDAEEEDGSHRRSNEAKNTLEHVEEVESLDGINGDGEDDGEDGAYYGY